MNLLLRFLIGCLFLSLMSCGFHTKPIKISCPNYPVMEPVVVKQNAISGVYLTNTITNHLHLWEYIHLIEKLGCIR